MAFQSAGDAWKKRPRRRIEEGGGGWGDREVGSTAVTSKASLQSEAKYPFGFIAGNICVQKRGNL